MKKFFCAVGAVLMVASITQTVSAQVGTTAVPFLLIAPNSRASGMGEGGTGIADDAASMHWNPAGLAFQKGGEISITHANWLPQFHLSDLFYDYFNIKQEMPDYGGTLGASVTYLNLGEFVVTSEKDPTPISTFKGFEVAVTLGYGTLITDELGIGTNLRYINSSLSPIGTANEKGNGIANDFSFDLAFLYRPKSLVLPFIDEDIGDRFSVGVNLSNIGPKVIYIDAAQADPLPTQLRLGFGIVPLKDEFNSLTIALDFSKLLVYREPNGASHELPKSLVTSFTNNSLQRNLKLVNTSLGLEYWYDKKVALRWGYFFEDPSNGNRNFMTFGAGLRYDIYGFDFSYISSKEENSPLSDTLRFTLLIIWGGLL
ncbi:MAG: type IX secretion system outer membrane channel protein PorV [Bacteroidota bacterium]|nr:type IX secretion system outer membrane channel protein PorV [Bacteroidota bacterium]